eukprot:tig00020572_g11535.t2
MDRQQARTTLEGHVAAERLRIESLMAELEACHRQMAGRLAAHEQEVAGIRAAHEREVAGRLAAHEQEVAGLQAIIAALRREIDGLRNIIGATPAVGPAPAAQQPSPAPAVASGSAGSAPQASFAEDDSPREDRPTTATVADQMQISPAQAQAGGGALRLEGGEGGAPGAGGGEALRQRNP